MTVLANDAGCYYGVHFGCLCAARDPNCQRCAERLTKAVNYELHTAVSTIDHRTQKMRRLDATTTGGEERDEQYAI